MAPPSSSTMKHTCTQLTDCFQSVLLLKIDGLSVSDETVESGDGGISSRCSVEGYDWEICFIPTNYHEYSGEVSNAAANNFWLALDLVLLSQPRAGSVTASLSGRILDRGTGCCISPYDLEQKNAPKAYRCANDQSNTFYIGVGSTTAQRIYGLTVECTTTVFTGSEAIPVPPSDLSRHLGELLRSQAGADVTFLVSGESFPAHKSVLATRSPVFMAEFFGEMKVKNDKVVEILEMDAAAFKAMLHFIYTDEVPELRLQEAAEPMALAQHLIVAADKYGLERLKVMCERRLALTMDVSTVASTLALAEQQNCSLLKAKCIEFIAGGSQENLSAVLATEGYKHLVEKSPLMLTELLMAAHGRKRGRSPDTKKV